MTYRSVYNILLEMLFVEVALLHVKCPTPVLQQAIPCIVHTVQLMKTM